MKEVYHIDELLLEKQKISNTNLIRILSVLAILFVLIFFFYIYTRSLSRKIVQSEKAAAEAAARSEANNREMCIRERNKRGKNIVVLLTVQI